MVSHHGLAKSAAAVQQYVNAMRAIDLKDVPDDFRGSYARHLEAWQAVGELLEHYSGLSGSFRLGVDGDDYVKARLAAADKDVTDTWAAVKDKAKVYGVAAPPD